MRCMLAVNHFTVKSVDFLAKSSPEQDVCLQPDLEWGGCEKIRFIRIPEAGGEPQSQSSVLALFDKCSVPSNSEGKDRHQHSGDLPVGRTPPEAAVAHATKKAQESVPAEM